MLAMPQTRSLLVYAPRSPKGGSMIRVIFIVLTAGGLPDALIFEVGFCRTEESSNKSPLRIPSPDKRFWFPSRLAAK
jgi:hypothetical protein